MVAHGRAGRRWSGTPSRTRVSQVPQVPSRQLDSTATPAARIASSTDVPGSTVIVAPVRASATSNGSSRTGGGTSRGTKRSTCSVRTGHRTHSCSTASSSGPGPQQ